MGCVSPVINEHPVGIAADWPIWLQGQPGEWQLLVHAQPGGRSSEILGTYDGALKVRVAAPAVEGRANAQLQRFIAKRLGVAKGCVALVAGASARSKRIRITVDLTREALLAKLEAKGPDR